MPNLSHGESVKVYAENSTARAWSLIKVHVNLRITPVSDNDALNEGSRFPQAASVTHRGRCAYDADLDTEGTQRRLLVRISDGAQFIVLRWREGRGRRPAGHPDMVLSLFHQQPKLHNLYDT